MKRPMLFLLTLALAAAVAVGCQKPSAENKTLAYPVKPITVIVPFDAGSATDIGTRQFFEIAQKELGQPAMIVNKPGASASIGTMEIHDAKPDGYTLGLECHLELFKPLGLLPYDHHEFDVLAVLSLSRPLVAVPSTSPFQSLTELVDYARAHPEKLRLSAVSRGARMWVCAKLFEQATGAKFNFVENPGAENLVATQLAGGNADVGVVTMSSLRSFISAGKVRVLGVAAPERLPGLYEGIPTLREQGIDCVTGARSGLIAPKGLPKDVHDKLVSTFAKILASPEWANLCAQRGAIPAPELVDEEYAKYLDREASLSGPLLESMKKGGP